MSKKQNTLQSLIEGIDVLFDDIDENISNKFKKHDLIGIPYQIIVGSKTTKDKFEFKEVGKEPQVFEINKIINLLKNKLFNTIEKLITVRNLKPKKRRVFKSNINLLFSWNNVRRSYINY